VKSPMMMETPARRNRITIESVRRNMAKKKPANPFQGQFRITFMELYDPVYVEEEGDAFFRFDPKGLGEFQFGNVQGEMDCHFGMRDGQPLVEFTWEGHDEEDRRSGRGWAILQGKEIEGEFFFHLGDATAFKAVRKR
jgi:hypothetical protein